MEIITTIGQYLADIFFEKKEEEVVHNVHIVDVVESYREVFPKDQFENMFVAGPYEGVLGDAIRGYKYGRDISRINLLVESARLLIKSVDRFDAIVVPPTPLLRGVLRLGRCPIAEIIAQAGYAEHTWNDLFRSNFHRPRQAPKNRADRLLLLQKIFFHLNPSALPRIAGKRLVIMDDVLSTGATAHTIARTLRNAWAEVRTGLFLASGSYPTRHEQNSRI